MARQHPAAGGRLLDVERDERQARPAPASHHSKRDRPAGAQSLAHAARSTQALRATAAYASRGIRSRNGASSRVGLAAELPQRRRVAARRAPRRAAARRARAAASSNVLARLAAQALGAAARGVELAHDARRSPRRATDRRRRAAPSAARRRARDAPAATAVASRSRCVARLGRPHRGAARRRRGATRRTRRARRPRRTRRGTGRRRGPLRVVALEVAIDAAARHLQRHAARRPAAHLLERRPDDANQVTVVLAAEIRLDLRGSTRGRRASGRLDSATLSQSTALRPTMTRIDAGVGPHEQRAGRRRCPRATPAPRAPSALPLDRPAERRRGARAPARRAPRAARPALQRRRSARPAPPGTPPAAARDRRRGPARLRATSPAPRRRADTPPACTLMPKPSTTCGTPRRRHARLGEDAGQLSRPPTYDVVRPLHAAASSPVAAWMPSATATPAAIVSSGTASRPGPQHGRDVEARARRATPRRARAGRGPPICASATTTQPSARRAPPARTRRRWSTARRVPRRAMPSVPAARPASASSSAASGGRASRSLGVTSRSRLRRFDLEAEVDGRRRVRQRADRDEVGAGRRQLRHAAPSVTPPEISVFARPAAARAPPRRCRASTGCRAGRCRRRRAAPRPPARGSAPRPRSASRGSPCASASRPSTTPPASRTWLSLIRMPVVQAAAMIDAAAGAHGVLLERAQQRRRLARVEDDDAARRPRRRTGASAWRCRDSRCRKLSAVRSAVSSAAAWPRYSATTVPGSHALAVLVHDR